MSKELECLDRIDKRNYLTEREHKEFLGVVEKAIKEYEAIDNANHSEALEELKRIDYNITYLLSDCDIDEEVSMSFNSIRDNKSCEVIKQALLKAQDNARSEEILQKYYQEGITLDSVRALKLRIEALEKDLEEQRELAKHYLEEQEKEIIELRQKAQESKKYLKWEDLEFKKDVQKTLVLLNNTKYQMCYFKCCYECINLFTEDGKRVVHICEGCFSQDKQFFNDLRLERVEE